MSEERYTGPSKEQLEFYFRTSRPYFDELAKEYEKKHPGFYKKYFAPFYAFSFGGPKSSKPKGTGAGFMVFIAALVLAVGIAAAVFFLVMQQSSTEQTEIESTRKPAEKKENVQTTKPSETKTTSGTDDAEKKEVKPDNLDKPLKDGSKDEQGRNLRRKPYMIYR